MTEQERKLWHRECSYAYFWESIPGIGKKSIAELHNHYKSYETAYRETTKYPQLLKKEKQRQAYLEQKKSWDVQKEYEKLRESGIFCMPKALTGYPSVLKETEDAPSALFVKGKLPDEDQPLIALIGARSCTNYGAYVAKELGKRLAYEGMGVISGMARGIDGIGQWAALTNKGATFAVLGSGADVCYPEENRKLYQSLCAGEYGGGVISEFLPGTQAGSRHFPVRNRIISGMADAVVVVEAKEKSGTFITVMRALEQGKDVYAVPGRLTDPMSAGCLKLIQQGADLIWNLDLFIQRVKEDKAFRLARTEIKAENTNRYAKASVSVSETQVLKQQIPYGLTALQIKIYESLDFDFQDTNSILCKLNDEEFSVSEILAAMSDLECKNIIEQDCGFYRWRVSEN